MVIGKIFEQARATPDKTAFIHNGAACSYALFARRIAAAHEFFARQNLRAGSVAVLCIGNLPEGWVQGMALRGLGLTTVAVDSADAIANLGLGNISCVVTIAAERYPKLAALAAAARWMTLEVPARTGPGAGGFAHPPAMVQHPAGHIIATSGTTGAYKKILRDALAEASTLDLHAQINGISAASVVYVRDFPLWTAGGYRWPLLTWSQGATVVFQQGRDFHRPHLDCELTHAFDTPATLAHLMGAPEGELRRNDRLRLLVTGGALPRALAVAARDRLTLQVCKVLASTEALTVSVTPVEDVDDLYWHRIHPSREVEVVDEADRVLPAGQMGLVRVRILDGVAGYLDDAAASRAFFRDGWFYPGDLGVFGPDKRLALYGRVTDVLNVQGNKIGTGPIERELQDRLAVEGVCVFSLQSEGTDEEVYVAIQSRRSIAPDELKAVAQGVLGVFPRLHFHFVDTLPRNQMGKIQRLVLKQQLLARQAG